MLHAPVTLHEDARLRKLQSYNILDTAAEQIYDDVAFIASQICRTSIVLISFVDKERQWFKSKLGLDIVETAREVAICSHTIQSDELLCVPDTRKDTRFHDNPLVVREPNVVFYAGAPLISPEGYRLGAICTVDSSPRILNQEQKSVLTSLSKLVVSLLEARLHN